MRRLGKRIEQIRKLKGWTMDQFAEITGIAKSTLADYISGSDGKFSNLKKIAQMSNTPIEELIADEKYIQNNHCNEIKQVIQVNINLNINANNEDEVIKIVEALKPIIK